MTDIVLAEMIEDVLLHSCASASASRSYHPTAALTKEILCVSSRTLDKAGWVSTNYFHQCFKSLHGPCLKWARAQSLLLTHKGGNSLQQKSSNKPQDENKIFHGRSCLPCECLFTAWTMQIQATKAHAGQPWYTYTCNFLAQLCQLHLAVSAEGVSALRAGRHGDVQPPWLNPMRIITWSPWLPKFTCW